MSTTDNSEPVFALLRGLGIYNNPASGRDCLITKDNFNKGNQIFFFSHTNDTRINPDLYQELKRGNMKFELRLAATKDHAIVAIIHSIYQAELKIYGDRRVLFEEAST